jgi:hypothetical protein
MLNKDKIQVIMENIKLWFVKTIKMENNVNLAQDVTLLMDKES